ncbi:MAG: hypothetical protein K2W95_11025 [Candidatus Obscuribacterales bacterium]|nr:hypothetical protein [Candidatus Obscuribacterales bacterium]
MNNDKTSVCSRCRSEVALTDKFCQECGLARLAQPKASENPRVTLERAFSGALADEQVVESLDFSPAPRAADSAPPVVPPATVARLHSPLLHLEVIDCSPPPIGIDALPAFRSKAETIAWGESDQRTVRGAVEGETAHDVSPHAKLSSSNTVTQVAVLDAPTASRAYAGLLNRQAERKSSPVLFSGGPLFDLLGAATVLMTLTAIAWSVGSHIHQRAETARNVALTEIVHIVNAGDYKRGIAKLDALAAAGATLEDNQKKLLNESLYRAGAAAFCEGNFAMASNFLNRLEPDSRQASQSRAMLVAMNLKSADTPVEPIKIRKRPMKPLRLQTSSLNEKQELALPELPEPTSEPIAVPEAAAEPTTVIKSDSGSIEFSPSTEVTATEKPAAPRPPAARCSEAEIAKYNRMLAKWFASSKSRSDAAGSAEGSADAAAEPRDPPSFREWLQQGKPTF